MPDKIDQIKLQRVKEFLSQHTLGVLSTVNQKALPESAVIGFSENGDFEIIFGTFFTSRKYQNLQRNPFVALVVGWDKGKTVQLEGKAEEILDKDQIQESIKVHLAKIPSAVKIVTKSEERLFRIKPNWIRYTDLSVDPWDVFEIIF